MSEPAATASISGALVTDPLVSVKPQVSDLHGRSWEEIETAGM